MIRNQLVFLFIAFLPAPLWAYGLGNIKVNSSINEPLDAEIRLTDIKPQELKTLQLQLLTELQKPAPKKTAKGQFSVLPRVNEAVLKAELASKNGTPVIHITSEQPLYANCNKLLFKCYRFYRFGLQANWGRHYWQTHVKRSYSIIPAMDFALGDVEMHSSAGQRLDMEIGLLKQSRNLSSLRVNLAPREAWIQGIHFGAQEYELAQELGIEFKLIDGKIKVFSKNQVNRSSSNRVQTIHDPLVLLLEAVWEQGRELKKYTIYLSS